MALAAQQQSIWQQYPNAHWDGQIHRRANLGFRVESADDQSIFDTTQILVTQLQSDSPAAQAGLEEGDVILAINDEEFPTGIMGSQMLKNLPGEAIVTLAIQKEGGVSQISFTPQSAELEDLSGVDTYYGTIVTDDGTALRTLLTIPENTEGPLPAILISDWTSCSSTEVPVDYQRGWINFLRGLIQTTGAIVLRVDKPGCGDSQGHCSELDFDGTIAYQRKALRWLKTHSRVDATKIFIDGESVGAFMAPLVAEGEGVNGIIVRAGGATTWFERMMMFERLQRELSGESLAEIDSDMKQVAEFFHYYLTKSLPLDEIFERQPAMRTVWDEQISYNSETKHYGRPITFHQQAQSHNFARAWVESGARALVLIGEYDQFESIAAARTLVRAVNRANPGFAELKVYPEANHQLELFDTHEAAKQGYPGRTLQPNQIGVEQPLADVRAWMELLTTDDIR